MILFRSKKEFEQELILRSRDGASVCSLSRLFEISRNTVRRILRKHAQERKSHEILPRMQVRTSKLDEFKPRITQLLEKFPKISGLRMYEELKDEGFDGGITILRDFLKVVRKPLVEPVIRMVVSPGGQGQMDWSPYKIPFVRTGMAEVQCFS
jgi:transposase